MSNPQIENGFIKIANELFRAALRYKFKQHHKAVYEAILIQTYGFNKKEDDISLSQLEKMTGILASNCSKACTQLVELNVIHRRRGVFGHIMGINKNYSKWHGWDQSWEYWNQDEKEEPEVNFQKSPPETKELTLEQTSCWEWSKNDDFWQEKVATQRDFLKHYNSSRKTLKTQYERFKRESEKRREIADIKFNPGANHAKPTTQRDQYFARQEGINSVLGGKAGTAYERFVNRVDKQNGGSFHPVEPDVLEGVEFSVYKP